MAAGARQLTPSRGAVHWNPLRLDGTALPETLLLATRLLAIVVAIGGYWPFERGVVMFDFLGQLGSVDQFTTALRFDTSVGVVILLFTQWVRVGAALIRTTILIGLWAPWARTPWHTPISARSSSLFP